MLELLRYIRKTMYYISSIQVFGFQIDTALHIIGGFIIFLILCRFISIKKSLVISFGIIILKEIVDVFAKSKIEYIRPPHLDLLFDLLGGTLGILIALYYVKYRSRKRGDISVIKNKVAK